MNRHDLPYYENILCVRMSFIEPFCTDWEAVTVNHLIELKRCLIEEWLNFQRAIIEDIRCGFSATLLRSVNLSNPKKILKVVLQYKRHYWYGTWSYVKGSS